jgi:transposase InsO family protein
MYMWVSLLRSKEAAMAAFKSFQARAEVEAGRKVGTFRMDRGGEFTAQAFIEHCYSEGIKRHLIAPYTLEQNGVVERRNQTIMGMARSMLKAMNLPNWFWGEAMAMAIYILNRSPTQGNEGSTPYDI